MGIPISPELPKPYRVTHPSPYALDCKVATDSAPGCGTQRLDWVWQMWKVVLSPLKQAEEPAAIFWDDLDNVDRQHWLCIQHLLVPKDRCGAFAKM